MGLECSKSLWGAYEIEIFEIIYIMEIELISEQCLVKVKSPWFFLFFGQFFWIFAELAGLNAGESLHI